MRSWLFRSAGVEGRRNYAFKAACNATQAVRFLDDARAAWKLRRV